MHQSPKDFSSGPQCVALIIGYVSEAPIQLWRDYPAALLSLE